MKNSNLISLVLALLLLIAGGHEGIWLLLLTKHFLVPTIRLLLLLLLLMLAKRRLSKDRNLAPLLPINNRLGTFLEQVYRLAVSHCYT